MGNTCTTASFPVPELEAPPALPGAAGDFEKLSNATAIHLPGTKEYEFCRKDKSWIMDPVTFGRPAAIAVPKTPEEVVAVVKFAQATGIKLTVACGRHTHESVKQGVLMIDLSHGMNEVTVDSATKTLKVQGGATIGKVDQACAPHKLLLPMGRIGTTGCAGQMITTGAHGYCERMYGLGVDYMTAATVVTGAGDIVRCSATENAELFWAIRGGANNFGVICDMTFAPATPPNDGKFLAGTYVYLTVGAMGFPTRQQVMDHVVECMDADGRPHEYGASAVFLGGGIAPVIVNHFWFGADQAAGREYFKTGAKKIAFCVDNTMGVHDYWGGIQKWAQGPKGDQAGPGAYYYRGVMPHKFTAEMGRLIVDACKGPYPKGVQPMVLVDLMGGKASEVPLGTMALPARPKYWIVIICNWKPEVTGPAGRDFSANWVRTLWQGLVTEDMKHASTGEATVDIESHASIAVEIPSEANTMTMGQQAKVRKMWGDNESRMQRAKLQFDPKNVFGCTIPGVPGLA